MTDRSPEDDLAAELAREVVARVSPQELPIFGPTSRAYFANPDQALQQRSKEETLGFGGPGTLAVLTPYVLAIARPVVALLLREVADQATERSAEVVRRWVRRLLGQRDPAIVDDEESELKPLSPDQLRRVRELALDKARELDLDEDKAGLLADAMVGSLVLPPS